METAKPVHRISDGNIHCSIWKKGTSNKPYYVAALSKSYAQRGGKISYVTTFGYVDLEIISRLSAQASEWIKAHSDGRLSAVN
jgi:hypothetical protein